MNTNYIAFAFYQLKSRSSPLRPLQSQLIILLILSLSFPPLSLAVFLITSHAEEAYRFSFSFSIFFFYFFLFFFALVSLAVKSAFLTFTPPPAVRRPPFPFLPLLHSP